MTANQVVAGSPFVVKSKPYFEEKITKDILPLEKFPLPTKECRNILKDNAITAFDKYLDQIKIKNEVIDFVKKN